MRAHSLCPRRTASLLSRVVDGPSPAARDAPRSLFGLAMLLALASVLLREIHGVRLSYDLLSFVWFASWVAGGVSVVASLADIARAGRQRSLYLAITVIAVQLLAFQEETDDDIASLLAMSLWALMAGALIMEARSLMRSGPSSEELDADDSVDP